jgi:glyoxylase I family protein
MTVTYSFAGIPVTDFAAAYDWYVRLLGRAADMFPHEREAVWRLTPTSAIYVVEDARRAGSALVALALDDLAAHEAHLRSGGFEAAEDLDRAPVRRLAVDDPDGNTLTFFEDPAQAR